MTTSELTTTEAMSVAERLFVSGPAVLLEEGWTTKQINTFLLRPDVQDYFSLLKREFEAQEALAARTRYIARRKLSRHAGKAVDLLGQAIDGATYARDENGNCMLDAQGRLVIAQPEPSTLQVKSAEIVVSAVGTYHHELLADASGDERAQKLLRDDAPARQNIRVEGASEEERTRSRDRIRAAIERLRRDPKLKRVPVAKLLVRATKKPRKKSSGSKG